MAKARDEADPLRSLEEVRDILKTEITQRIKSLVVISVLVNVLFVTFSALVLFEVLWADALSRVLSRDNSALIEIQSQIDETKQMSREARELAQAARGKAEYALQKANQAVDKSGRTE